MSQLRGAALVLVMLALPVWGRIAFEPNRGQAPPEVRYTGRGVWLLNGPAVMLAAPGERPLRVEFAAANPRPAVEPFDPLPHRTHYLRGRDPRGWLMSIRSFARVRYARLYPGIDAVFYGNPDRLECDFLVAPGAEPRAIRIRFSSGAAIRLEASGDLIAGGVRFHKPAARQGGRAVASAFRLIDRRTAAFELGPYNRGQPLTIDPEITFATYLGGGGTELSRATATDSDGNIYVAGRTDSPNFPVASAMQDTSRSYSQAFVTKFDKNGNLIFSTYLGGSENDAAWGIALDRDRNIYITGNAHSKDFPVVNAFQPAQAPQSGPVGDPQAIDAFVAKLSADGSRLLYSTYLGGHDHDFGEAIAVDAAGSAYVTGRTESGDFPVTPGAFQVKPGVYPRSPNVFLAKLSPSGSELVYSTYLSGTNSGSTVAGVAVDSLGQAIVAGSTSSLDFPTRNALIPSPPDRPMGFSSYAIYSRAFVAKFNAAGSDLLYSTYLNYTGPSAAGSVAVDAGGNAYVAGNSGTVDFVMRDDAPLYLAGDLFLRSTDDGATFTGFGSGLRVSGVNSIASCASDPRLLYAATTEGIFRSADQGETWEYFALRPRPVSQVVLDPFDASRLYALAADQPGVTPSRPYTSTDGGQTWSPLNQPGPNSYINKLIPDPATPGTLYALGGGAFKSADYGGTWRRLLDVGVDGLAIDPSNPQVVYAASNSYFCGFFCGVVPGQLMKSVDGGMSWQTKRRTGRGTVVIDPNAPSVIYVDGARSLDGGESFTPLPSNRLVVAVDAASRLYASSSAGLERSSDRGETWAPVPLPLSSSRLTSFFLDPVTASTLYLSAAAAPDAFVVKLDPQGQLVYSRFFGGSEGEQGDAIAVDAAGNAYLAGWTTSPDLPAAGGLLPYSFTRNSGDTFVARFSPDGSAVTLATYLGNSHYYSPKGVAVDPDGEIVVVGTTFSQSFPVKNAVQDQLHGLSDVFVVRVQP